MDELSAALEGGSLLLFSTEQAILSGRGQLSAMNSNLWFFLPVLVTAACIGLCIYQCNMFTYTRMSL